MTVENKKKILFYAAVTLMFMTSMSKVLIPNTVFDELQSDLGISGQKLAAMGSAFMCTYAISQLALGLLSSKYGGVRVLLFASSVFTVGCVCFPFLSSANLMIADRALTGLGAGTAFIAVAKLTDDLFKKNFSMVLGIVLFLTYFGPVTGNLPMVAVVKATSWRSAMMIPAAVSLLLFVIILICLKGTLKPVLKGNAITPLLKICSDKNSWLIFTASSVVFGSYYFIATTAGNKMLTDIGKMKPLHASLIITAFALIVAFNNIFGNIFLIKVLHERRKLMMFLAGLSHTAGTMLCACAFYFDMNCIFIIAGFLLISIPAGLFSIYCTVIKELNPPEYTGLAIAILNFFAFVAIAGWGYIAGVIFSRFESGTISGSVHYPPTVYALIFAIFAAFAIIGFICSCFLPETAAHNSQK